jgi:hypothetical protein
MYKLIVSDLSDASPQLSILKDMAVTKREESFTKEDE